MKVINKFIIEIVSTAGTGVIQLMKFPVFMDVTNFNGVRQTINKEIMR